MSAGNPIAGLTGTWNGAVQTSYDVHPNQGVPGQITHITEPREMWGGPVAVGAIGCGRAVAKGDPVTMTVGRWGNTNSPYHLIPTTTTTTAPDVYGIAVWDPAARVFFESFRPIQPGGNLAPAAVTMPYSGYMPGDMMTVMRRGYIWVRNYGDVTIDAQVYMVINATNTLDAQLGEFVPTDLGGAAIVVPGITWAAQDIWAMSKVAIVKVALA